MSMREELLHLLNSALDSIGIKTDDILLERPDDIVNGDYSTNIALVLAKKLNKKPVELAKEIVEKIKDQSVNIKEIKTAGPGFINFYLGDKYLINEIEKSSAGIYITGKKNREKIMVEYTDANPLKEFHIGHLMSNTIGEAVAGVSEAVGNEVRRACYQGDVGTHIAKALWGALKQKKERGSVDWNSVYAEGAKAFEDSESVKKEIEEINRKVYGKDPEVYGLYEEGKKYSLGKFEEMYKKLGTHFDYYFFESEVADAGKKIVQDNVGKIFEKSDGAIIFPGEKYGLHTRVFINSQGIPTYEAKELGLAGIKAGKFNADKFIVVTGNEIIDYFRVLKKALSLIDEKLAEKVIHYPHGMLRLPSGKMSSRTGNVITTEALINKVSDMVMEKIKDRDFEETEKKDVAEKVAVAAIKYSILKSSTGSDIIFDFDKSISFEGDSGPYLQYSYARAMAVLRKAEDLGIKVSDLQEEGSITVGALERKLIRLEEVVIRASNEMQPHYIANYLTDLASEFNSFYGNNQIIDDKNSDLTNYRLVLTKAFANTVKKGLEILAIPFLDRM